MSKPTFTNQDHIFMKRALDLASKAKGRTSPNPMVGAVLVKNNKIIAEGYHKKAGHAHAEIETLQKLSSKQIKGSKLYITLEPCNHFGRTPPCTNFLIEKNVKHIIIAMRDPNPKVNGQGIKKLQQAGVKIEAGLLEKEALKLNEIYLYGIKTKQSFVTIKAAVSLDGKIATATGNSRWISNEQSRTEAHRLRNKVDAILTTSKTVLADDPHLGVRMVKGRDPLRIILDRNLETPLTAKVYRDKNVLVVTTNSSSKQQKVFKKVGIALISYPQTQIPLKKLLKDLYIKGISHIMIEAGSGLMTGFFKQKLVQKLQLFIAPKIIGKGLDFVGDLGIKKIAKAIHFEKIEIKSFGNDIMFVGYPTF